MSRFIRPFQSVQLSCPCKQPPDLVKQAEVYIRRIAEYVCPTDTLDVLKEDPTDNRILDRAKTAQSKYIVSGDKHLLNMGHYADVRIVTVAAFLRSGVYTANFPREGIR